MALIDLLGILFLVLNFIFSLWNGYVSGYNLGLVRKFNITGFRKYASYSGIGLAYCGMVYVLIVVISLAAYYLNYISSATAAYALSFNFLVFGLLIIAFGFVVTIQSIIIAYQRRNFWSILRAIFNVAVEIFDIYSYVSSFKQAVGVLNMGNRRGQGNIGVIVIAALLIGFLIVHAMYKHGFNKAMNSNLGPNAMRPQGVKGI